MIVNGMCIAQGEKNRSVNREPMKLHASTSTRWGVHFGAKSNFTKLLRPVGKPYIHTCEY